MTKRCKQTKYGSFFKCKTSVRKIQENISFSGIGVFQQLFFANIVSFEGKIDAFKTIIWLLWTLSITHKVDRIQAIIFEMFRLTKIFAILLLICSSSILSALGASAGQGQNQGLPEENGGVVTITY